MEEALVADPSMSLVVLEMGCGERVPSVRMECEAVVRDCLARGGAATLIRINPDGQLPAREPDGQLPDSNGRLREHTIVIREGAAVALASIDALMK